MANSTPPAKRSAPTAPRPAIGKGKALLRVERAARGLRTRRPPVHPQLRRHAVPRPASFEPDQPSFADTTLAAPAGGGGGGEPGPQSYWKHPPGSHGGWLNGIAQHMTPTPAMLAVAENMHKLGFYSKRQADNTWSHISKIRSVN